MAVSGRKTDVKSHLMKRRQLLHKTSSCKILSWALSLSLSLYIYKKTFSPTQRFSNWHLTRRLAQVWFTTAHYRLKGPGFSSPPTTQTTVNEMRGFLRRTSRPLAYDTAVLKATQRTSTKNIFLQSCRKLNTPFAETLWSASMTNNKTPKELRVNFSYTEFNHNVIKIFIKKKFVQDLM